MFNYSVSVLVLTYNHEDFILDALNSIELQCFKSVQVVVGDDASVDDTRNKIERFSLTSELDYVLLYNDVNFGITANFNRCLEACEGQYIFLLGGDDLFCENKIQRQYDFMERHKEVVISCHDALVFDSETGDVLNYYSDYFKKAELDIVSLVKFGPMFTGCSAAIRNSATLPRCRSEIKYASDWLWYIEVLIESGGKIGYLECVLSKYRRHEKNITSVKNINISYEETMSTLEIVQENYHFLKLQAFKSTGERKFAFALKYFLILDFYSGIKLLVESVVISPFSPLRFMFIRMNNLRTRMKRFYKK